MIHLYNLLQVYLIFTNLYKLCSSPGLYFSESPASSPREAVAEIRAQLALIQEPERPRYRHQGALPPPALVGAEAVHDLYRRAKALNQGQPVAPQQFIVPAIPQQPTVPAALQQSTVPTQPTVPTAIQQPIVPTALQQSVSVVPAQPIMSAIHVTMSRHTLGHMNVKCIHCGAWHWIEE